ncbi:hypothetical protein HMPREF9946_00935 [Acetobacteraceae bacterium AT-5844]|nr:hypothetical protein HMPREF9946_00935 [Acetobacteraceae bacterium AT-5844]
MARPFPAAALRRRGIDAAAGWSASSRVVSVRLQHACVGAESVAFLHLYRY